MERKEGEKQDEFGWEDVQRFDDGSPEGLDTPPEPTPEPPTPEPVATSPDVVPEPTPVQPPEPAEPAEPVAAEPAVPEAEPGAEPPEPTPEPQTYTLPDGRKITAKDLADDPGLITTLVTHTNQVANYQRLAEERGQQAADADSERRKMLDQYTEWQLQRERQTQQQAPPQERPAAAAIHGAFAPHISKLRADGRISEDQETEFGPLIAEYMFDHQNMMNLIGTIATAAEGRLGSLEGQVTGEIVPDLAARAQTDAQAFGIQVQQQVSARPGYEILSDPEQWNKLNLFIAEKVAGSQKDVQGRPTFNPMYDPDTMAQMYDAMTGAELRMRMAVIEAGKTQAATAAAAAVQAGGETTAKAGVGPPKQLQPSDLTPAEEAMDFADPRTAIG